LLVKFRYLSISFDRRGETDRLLTPIRGHAGKPFGGEMHGCRPEDAEGAPNPASWPFRALVASTRPSAPFLARADRSTAHILPSAGRYRRRPHGQLRGKMPELMSMRPRAFRLPDDSIEPRTVQCRSRRPFLEGNGRRTLKMPDEPI